MIKRANSTVSYSINFPLAMIKDIGWNKGDNLEFQMIDGKIIISLEEIQNEGS